MKILSVWATNFASYKTIEFDFTNQGLCLIQGATGSGKSTLCDLIPWALFSKTAKGGTVEEILSWPGNEVTMVDIVTDKISIRRTRGPKAKDNDLYFATEPGIIQRGRDLNDTQRLINQHLGMDYDLYLASAYFHEFSQTAQFFTTTAKNRRVICEQIVDLTLAKKLQVRLSDEYKEIDRNCTKLQAQVALVENTVKTLLYVQESETTKAAAWSASQEKTKAYVLLNYEKFEANRTKTIKHQCPTCNTILKAPQIVIDDSVNPHIDRLAGLELEVNPYGVSAKDFSTEIHTERNKLGGLNASIKAYEEQLTDIELLQQVTNDYRSVTIANTIGSIEANTNKLLADHFDAEIRVKFDSADKDKIDVKIYKDGNLASFTQLSKGQRGILKFCFGTSVMTAVQNHNGLSVSQVFYDEALDGLDDSMKLKAYGLLETISLSYESIFVVEHSAALKTCFPNTYSVELVNGESQITKTT